MYAFEPTKNSCISVLLNHGLYRLPMKKAKSFENKAIEKKSFIPKSLSVIDMMKLGKLIQKK